MSFQTAWLIGQNNSTASFDVTVNGGPVSVAAGAYYLDDASASRSLVQAFAAASGLTVKVLESGKVRISDGAPFTVTWGAGTGAVLRGLLGFSADIAATSETAPIQSPLLWSPTYKAQSFTPPGVDAYPVPDTQVVASLTARTVEHVTNFTQERQEFSWDAVPIERVWPLSAGLGVTAYRYFWSDVLQGGERFKMYEVTEDPSSTTPATLGTAQGPYKMRNIEPKWYSRQIPNADIVSPINLEAVKVDEA